MSAFIGRQYELDRLIQLTRDSRAKLVVLKGRRRIGKSRLAEEFGRRLQDYRTLYFEALPSDKHNTAAEEREDFAAQVGRVFGVPPPRADDWGDLLWDLAVRVRDGGKKSLIIFDEINWMGKRDRTFLGAIAGRSGAVLGRPQ